MIAKARRAQQQHVQRHPVQLEIPTDDDIQALADEAERGYDLNEITERNSDG